ncbi:hypothetical protein SLA2020_329350 [Shorea laevis]
MNLTVLFWNVRGAASKGFLQTAQELIKKHKPDIFIIAEPRISGTTADDRINDLRFDESVKVDARGFSGGIWILWNRTVGDITILDCFSQAITLLVKQAHRDPWLLSAIYANPVPTIREKLWQHLEQFTYTDGLPWLLLGDFNQIISSDEHAEGRVTGLRGASLMMSFMQNKGLIDLGAAGCKYTWTNRQLAGHLVMKRLDRALSNVSWRVLFPEAFVQNLPRTRGDHCPIILNTKRLDIPSRSQRPFRFEAAWLTHPSFKNLLINSWNPDVSLHNALTIFTREVQNWNQQVFGNIFHRKRRLLARLYGVQKLLETQPQPSLFALETHLLREYNDTLQQEELLWFQKSRSKWVQFGDRNTRFFHSTTVIKRRKQRILALKRDDNTWCFEPNELRNLVVNFFKTLYSSSEQVLDPMTVMNSPQYGRLSAEQYQQLIIPICDEEIQKSIFSMDPYKAPGDDGFQPIFFQANWDIIGASVCSFIKTAFQQGSFDKDLNITLLCIIPKVEHPERLNQLCPISLCNVVVKAIMKVMVNRIKPFLTSIISPTQSSFIPGRGCHDNIIIVQEAIHSLKNCKGRVGNFAMKIDLEKAYDRIEWSFLEWVLRDVGIPESWISLIMFCVSTSSFSLLWNGEKTEPFTPR